MAFNFSGAYARPRGPYDAPPEGNFSEDGSTYTIGGNDVHTNTQPGQENGSGFQSFLGGMQPKNGKRGGILGGLSTLAGRGGMAGEIGGAAKFLL